MCFNVLSEPWIPVYDSQGCLRELGILPLLEQAHCLSAISHENPMVEFGLYRLLCVFLMDAYRPKTEADLDDLLEIGHFDGAFLNAYVTSCLEEGCSFNLFDSARPFLQSVYLEGDNPTPKYANALDETIPSGNKHIHFDHRFDEDVTFTYAEAARLLPACQIFCTAGLKGPSSPNASPPYFVLIKGKTLFETLVLMLLSENYLPPVVSFDDYPVFWRNFDEIIPKKEVVETSLLQGLLFPARKIQLVPDAAAGRVKQVYYGPGLNFKLKENWEDPATVFRIGKEGKFLWRPSLERAPWRNLVDLTNISSGQAPLVLQQYGELLSFADDASVSLVLYGVQTNQASYLSLHRNEMTIPRSLLGNEYILPLVEEFVNDSESLAFSLQRSFSFGQGKNKQSLLPNSIVSQAKTAFWGLCEAELYSVIAKVALVEGSFDSLRLDWKKKLVGYAWDCRECACQSVMQNGSLLLKLSKCEAELRKSCWYLLKEVKANGVISE